MRRGYQLMIRPTFFFSENRQTVFSVWASDAHLQSMSPHEFCFQIKVIKSCSFVFLLLFLFEWTCIGSQRACIHSVWSHPQDMYRPASLHSLSVNDAEIILHRQNKNSTQIHPDPWMAICPDIREYFLSLLLVTCYVHMERNVQILYNVLCVYVMLQW